jgi:hypothetical protein
VTAGGDDVVDRLPQPMAVHCPTCDGTVLCTAQGVAFFYDQREGPPQRWTLMQCARDHVLLVLQEFYGGGMEFDDDSPYRVYPAQDRQLSQEIPQSLRDTHEEARKCFRAKAWVATVAMSGRTLEATCKSQGVTKGVLQEKLAEMRNRGIIDGRLWEWAETLRGARNAAAHFDEEGVTRQDAEDSLAYSEALLDYLYVLTARFEAMKTRRSAAPDEPVELDYSAGSSE